MEKITRQATLGAWIAAATVIAVVFSWSILLKKNIPPQLPLFYSRPWGEEQLANPIMMTVPVGMIVFAAFSSQVFSKKLRKHPVLSATVAASILVSQIIMVLGIIRVVLLIM